MSELKIFQDSQPDTLEQHLTDKAAMAKVLADAGIRYEQWQATQELSDNPQQEEVIAAYKADIDRLIAEEGYQTVDVVSMVPDHPEKAAFRQKFLEEHRHSEDEVRFFVEGQGLFTLHIGERVYEVLCTKGDLISVPANTPHWFDMGPNPRFVAIRLFNNPEGWVANFTGSDIAQRFNRLGESPRCLQERRLSREAIELRNPNTSIRPLPFETCTGSLVTSVLVRNAPPLQSLLRLERKDPHDQGNCHRH